MASNPLLVSGGIHVPQLFVPALCKVGVFAVIGRLGSQNDIEILVNVRTDQDNQRQVGDLPDTWAGVIVDLVGGTLQIGDTSLEECLKRETTEETGGCDCKLIGTIIGPFPLIKTDTGTAEKPHDLAFVCAVELSGDPQPTPEASEHRWVTWQQLEAEQEVRLPGKLGNKGRMAKMISACLRKNEIYWKSAPIAK